MSLNALMGLHSHIFPRNRILSWHFFLFLYFNCSTVWWLTLFPTGNMLLFISFSSKINIFPPLAAYFVCLGAECHFPCPPSVLRLCSLSLWIRRLTIFIQFWKYLPTIPFFFLAHYFSKYLFCVPYPASGSKKNVSGCFIFPQGSLSLFIGQFLPLCLSVH